ncbi:MAG: FHA domain-containing protein [Deltaproteobacteria bacterium]|nr:FHA domain-containing protein [Deltaproteobacteria bacterium]
MARLVLSTAEGQQTIELRPTNSIGRHPSNTIQLLDRIVSKEHCIVELRADGYWLRDLGSLNGTYINNERVRGEQPLKHGDEIIMGSTRARFDDGRGFSVGDGFQPPPPAWQPPGVPGPGAASPQPGAAAPSPVSGDQYVPTTPGARQQPAIAGVPRPPGQFGTAAFPLQTPGGGAAAAAAAAMAQAQALASSRIDVQDQQRAIGTQIAARQKGFLPFDQVAAEPGQLRADYERLRLSHELSREIALERDTSTLLSKILQSIFKFVRADRGVIFLKSDETGNLEPRTSLRRDGSETAIVVSSTILNHVQNERAAVLTHDAAMDFAASKGKSMILNRISSAIVVPLLHNEEVLGVLWLDAESLAQFQPKDLEIVTGVAAQASMFIENNALAKKIEREIVTRERFSRLVSPNIADRIANGELEVKKGGELVKECTVFNSDIRGFTRMSDHTAPEIIVEMLNEYFEHMVETLFKYEGTLDKFMGDGLMALWGAPVVHPDDPIRAVQCGLEMLKVLEEFNKGRTTSTLPPLSIGIGIHTGPLVAGYIGSSKSLSYTVIGDTANTSARLCSHAAGGQIIVSETAQARLGGRFEYEELPPAKLKGKEKPMRIFNIKKAAPLVQVPAEIDEKTGVNL